jgi:hypothetical protein
MLSTVKGIVGKKQVGNVFYAVFDKVSKLEVPVIYTSPMYRVNGGGLLALPLYGDVILACHDEISGEYYYHSTIVSTHLEDQILRVPGFASIPNSDKTFDDSGRAVKVKYQNQAGVGLEITRNNRPAPLTPIGSVNLKSEKGKKVGLDDSPDVEAVVVQNQHGDGIILKGDGDKLFSSRSIRTSTYGSQLLESRGSSMDMHVVDGLDITIENRSSGAMGQTPSEQYWPNGKQPCRKWGGIYLRSDNGDVSIAANADTGDPEADGRIFITTPKARIQILEDGTIAIDSTTSIKLRTDGDLNMEGQNVNIKANGSLNMHSTSDTSISSDANVNADGGQIHLNSGNKINIATLGTHQDLDLNDYKE